MNQNNDSNRGGQPPRQPNRQSFWLYAGIVLLIMMLFNAFLMPRLNSSRVTEVTYDTFVQMVEEGKVDEVSVDENAQTITFSSPAADGSALGKTYYTTGAFPDPDLRQRLEDNGVKYAAAVPQENSFLMNFLLTWVFPTLLLLLPMILLMRSMNKLCIRDRCTPSRPAPTRPRAASTGTNWPKRRPTPGTGASCRPI